MMSHPFGRRRYRGAWVALAFAVVAMMTWGVARSIAAEDAAPALANAGGPSFRQDIVPLLTRYGCNAGGCHGKLAGQNGFKLSLRGYAPEWDHVSIVKDLRGRRIDYARPEASLLIAKATATVAHEGGKRFEKDSRAAKALAAWVEARTPGPDPAESDAVTLEILTGGSTTLAVGDTRQLVVKAHWPDGTTRDVTWLAQFFSNDESTISVTPDGLARAMRAGETAVRVHFQGLVEVVLFTMPYPKAVDPAQYSRKNNLVDEHVMAKLAALRIPLSPLADDATFVRRAYLDAIGTPPTADEVSAFCNDPSADKRAKLVDALLGRPEWADYWALNLCDTLQNRKERDHDVRGAKNVRAFHEWVRGQLAANRPWDQITRDLLTAKGDSSSTPQVGYFVYTIGEKQNPSESEVGESVAMAFLGTRIGCAKCHNHPLEKFTQDDYYRFVAFFAKVSLKRTDPEKGLTTLSVAAADERDARRQIADAQKQLDQARKQAEGKASDKEAAKKVAEAQRRVEDANRRLADVMSRPPTAFQPRTKKQMAAMPLDRSTPAFQPGHDPREALASWVTDPSNELFAGAMVNRVWRHFMGVGLVEGVDDLRSSNPPTNPELWRALSKEFVGHGYDLKSLMRLVMTSRAYQTSSETIAGNETDRRFYSHYYARRLPAEVLSDTIAAATGVPDNFPGYPVGVRAVQLPDVGVSSYFLTAFGRSERVTACSCEKTSDVTLPQVLYLTNGDEVRAKVRSGEGRLARILKTCPDDARAVDEVFLSALGRRANEAEVRAMRDALAGGDPREDVYRDLYWAVLNSKEFAFNH